MNYPTPRLPVLDWKTFSGGAQSPIPSLLNHSQILYTNSGRASILLALEILGIHPGETVLVPSYHCPTMVAPVVALGAQPMFYPIGQNGSPNMAWIRQQDTSKTRAILVAHFFGLPQPLDEIRAWCDQKGVRLIEDCAHALFGASGPRAIGQWGDLAIASLTKFLPVSEGGCLINNLAERQPSWLQQPSAKNQLKAGLDVIHSGVNHNRLAGIRMLVRGAYRLLGALKPNQATVPYQPTSVDPLQGNDFSIDTRLAHQRLTFASQWIARGVPRARIVAQRRLNYAFFTDALAHLSQMRPLLPDLPDACAPYVFPLLMKHPDPGYAELRRLEFPVSRWDRLWPTVPSIEGDQGVAWSQNVLQLACHQDLTQAELVRMVEVLKDLYETPA